MIRPACDYPRCSTAKVSMQAMVVALLFRCPQQSPSLVSRRSTPRRTVQPLVATPGVPFDVAFGVALTSDYVSRGITNSNSRPAIQGYIEPSVELPNIGTAYINVWSSNVDYGEGFEGAEIDVAGGIRPQFGPAFT